MTAQAEEPRWGGVAVDTREPSLPGLKARFVVERVPARGRLCEIGSGDGKLLLTLARERPDLELHGCDVRTPTRGIHGYAFRKVDGRRLPYDDGAFDVVIVFDVLEHVDDPAGMLDEVARILRPDGRFLFFCPVEGEPISFYTAYRKLLGESTYAETKEHIKAFTHRDLEELLAPRFTAVETKYAYHLLGHFMDASFFAAARLTFLRRFWWNENTFYNEEKPKGLLAKALNAALRAGNGLAYVESTVLSGVRTGAAGLLYCGKRR